MNSICPSCKRTVMVPPELVGKNVRCPACQMTFVVEEEPIEIVPIPQAAPIEPLPAPAPQKKAANPFEFAGPDKYEAVEDVLPSPAEEIRLQELRSLRSRLSYTSMLMTLGASVTIVLGLCALTSTLGNGGGSHAYVLGACFGSVVLITGSILVIVGASALSGRWSHGMAVTGAILSCVLGLFGLLAMCGSGMRAVGNGSDLAQLIGCFMFFMALLQVVCCLLGGIFALTLVFRSDVRDLFRAYTERQAGRR